MLSYPLLVYWIPPVYSWYPLTVLMIPKVYLASPGVLHRHYAGCLYFVSNIIFIKGKSLKDTGLVKRWMDTWNYSSTPFNFLVFCRPTARWFPYESERNKQPIKFNLDDKFCRPVLPHSQILCPIHFNLGSLYFSIFAISARVDPITSRISAIQPPFQ